MYKYVCFMQFARYFLAKYVRELFEFARIHPEAEASLSLCDISD